jgi:glycosyltransferase involved in cell wall biosynthesis
MKEGWGITNIEANACGTPVISANVPGLKDSVSEGLSGLLYEYGNITQLSSLIESILKDQRLRQNLFEGSIQWASKFSWDNSANLMFERCKEVIELTKK